MAIRPRLIERIGRVLGFSPEGRSVRVWVRGMPGADEDEVEVVGGTVVDVVAGEPASAVVQLREPARVGDREVRWLLAVPREPGWGLQALWFSFIAIDAIALEHDGAPPEAGRGEPLGRWFMRLGRAR